MSYDLKLNAELRDINFDKSGRLETVTSTFKLIQDIDKILRTKIRTNDIRPEYGCLLNTYIGTRLSQTGAEALFGRAIMESLERLINTKELQSLEQFVPDDEKLLTVTAIQVTQINPSTFKIDIRGISQRGHVISITRLMEGA